MVSTTRQFYLPLRVGHNPDVERNRGRSSALSRRFWRNQAAARGAGEDLSDAPTFGEGRRLTTCWWTTALCIPRSSGSNPGDGSARKWGTSSNNRRARFYTLTETGRRQLARLAPSSRRTGFGSGAPVRPEPGSLSGDVADGGAAAIYELAIRRWNGAGFVFGLKCQTIGGQANQA